MQRSMIAAAIATCLLLAASVAQEGTTRNKDHQHDMSPEAMAKEMRSMNLMMVEALGQKDANYEKRFIDIMIPHHEGAVLMARDALQKGTKPELKEMAEKMIREQQKEIAMMREYRKAWYGETIDSGK